MCLRPGVVVLCLFLLGRVVCSADAMAYSPSLRPGEACDVPLEMLRPTQFCVGEYEVRERAAKIAKMKPRKLNAYFAERVLPLVIGPGGAPYLIDHHHLARAVLESGVRTSVPAKILENWRDLDPPEFWKQMAAHGWVYLYKQGRGPLQTAALPTTLHELTDDPFRSLAWAAREFDPSLTHDETPYADFKWADEFRARMDVPHSDEAMREAAKQAAVWMRAHPLPPAPGGTANRKLLQDAE